MLLLTRWRVVKCVKLLKLCSLRAIRGAGAATTRRRDKACSSVLSSFIKKTLRQGWRRGNTFKCACACCVTCDVNTSWSWRHGGNDVIWWRRSGRHVKCLDVKSSSVTPYFHIIIIIISSSSSSSSSSSGRPTRAQSVIEYINTVQYCAIIHCHIWCWIIAALLFCFQNYRSLNSTCTKHIIIIISIC